MTRRTKWIVGGLVAVVAIIAAIQSRGSAVGVEVTEVRRSELAITVSNEGRTRARGRFTVASPVTGRVSRPTVSEGARIEAGAVLATVFPTPADAVAQAVLRAEVQAAEALQQGAQVEVAESDALFQQAHRETERRRALTDLGALSRETVERFERAEEAAAARFAVAKASLGAAEARAREARALASGADPTRTSGPQVEVIAPVAGTVLRVREESERVVVAGTPLFEVSDVKALEIVVDLLTEDAVRVNPGAPIRVTGWGGAEVLEGAVRYVEPAAFTKVSALGVEEQRVNVVADLAWAPEGLGVGYRADVAIVTWQGTDILVIPISALFRRDGQWHVFVEDGGRARLRPVTLGQMGPEGAEVREGLAEEEHVVVFPSEVEGDGARIRPVQ